MRHQRQRSPTAGRNDATVRSSMRSWLPGGRSTGSSTVTPSGVTSLSDIDLSVVVRGGPKTERPSTS